MEPIVGIRWRCLTCMDMEIDLCEKCFNTGFYKGKFNLSFSNSIFLFI